MAEILTSPAISCFLKIRHPKFNQILLPRKVYDCYVGEDDLKKIIIGVGSHADIQLDRCSYSHISKKQARLVVDHESQTVFLKQLTDCNVYDGRKRPVGKGQTIALKSGSKFWVSRNSYLVKVDFQQDSTNSEAEDEGVQEHHA